MELDPVSALPVHHVNRGWPPDYVEPLVEHALWVSPISETSTLLNHSRRAVIADELIGSTSRRDDPYFQFHILPYGYHHELLLHCRSGRTPRALFTFNRREGAGEFEQCHLRLLEMLSPHIGTAMHAACVRESLEAPMPIDIGFIVVDEHGRVAHAGGVGSRLMSNLTDGAALGLRVFLALVRRAIKDASLAMPPALVVSDPTSGAPYRLLAEACVSPERARHAATLIEPARRAILRASFVSGSHRARRR